jgi:uncharacterized protein HemX
VLDRAIGSKPNVEVDISDAWRLKGGDAILLCSDGLSGYVADPEIASVLQGQAAVQEIPERLVELALQKGGEDNVTVQFIQYGTRKEAQLTARKQLPFLLQMIAAIVLGAAISAAGFYQLRESPFRETASQLEADLQKSRQELEDTKAQLQQAQVNKNNLEGKLREAEKDKDNLKKQLDDTQKQLKKAGDESAETKKK